ncbi:L-asparaginase [Priestia endophytica]|nr:L-asparaginase [Priestia endophytica]
MQDTMTTGYQPGALHIDELLKEIPDLSNLSNIEVEQLFNIDSVDMTTERLLELGNYVKQILLEDEIDGVVITHGTDTLEETAYFLHLVVKSSKPVVIVGAVRPATALSADGPLNIYNGVKVACNKESHGKGILVVLGDRIGSARYMTKTHATTVDTFKAIEQGCIGAIVGSDVYFFYKNITYLHTIETVFDITSVQQLPKVSIIYAHQGDESFLYDAVIQSGAKGIVIATTGGYTLSKEAAIGARNALNNDIVVVRSSRLSSGIVSLTHMDTHHGYSVAEALNPQKARMLLMLALTKTNDKEDIRQFFYTY